jgi:hypothetical protein
MAINGFGLGIGFIAHNSVYSQSLANSSLVVVLRFPTGNVLLRLGSQTVPVPQLQQLSTDSITLLR